jgi:hypothetical protein
MVWYARPGCPEHRPPAFEHVVNALPVEWLATPVSGEVFESIIGCERRLRDYALAEDFHIIHSGADSKKTPVEVYLSQ